MTRETKIGLLVGLAFIIVIGILLSDQLMRATEPPQAPLTQVAANVRQATATPASNNPPITQVEPPANVQPGQPVPLQEDVVRREPPVSFGGGSNHGGSITGSQAGQPVSAEVLVG